MKTILNFLFFLWGIALLHSCQDENVAEMQTKDSEESITANDNSTFLVFSSKEDLKKGFESASKSLDSLGNKILEEADKNFKE